MPLRLNLFFVVALLTSIPLLVLLFGVVDRMEQVMKKFERSRAWNLPVVDRHNRYIGILSQSSIFSSYRNLLMDQQEI